MPVLAIIPASHPWALPCPQEPTEFQCECGRYFKNAQALGGHKHGCSKALTKYDKKTHQFHSRDGTRVFAPHFGGTSSFEALTDLVGMDIGSSIFFNLVQKLMFYGYEKGPHTSCIP